MKTFKKYIVCFFLLPLAVCFFVLATGFAQQRITGKLKYNEGTANSDDINAFYLEDNTGNTYVLMMCDDWKLTAGCNAATQVVQSIGKAVTVLGTLENTELLGVVIHVNKIIAEK